MAKKNDTGKLSELLASFNGDLFNGDLLKEDTPTSMMIQSVWNVFCWI